MRMISDDEEVSSVLGTVFCLRLVHVLSIVQTPKSSQAPAAMGPYIFTFFKFIAIKIYILNYYSKLKPNPLLLKSIYKKNPLLLINTYYKRGSQVCKIHTNVYKAQLSVDYEVSCWRGWSNHNLITYGWDMTCIFFVTMHESYGFILYLTLFC